MIAALYRAGTTVAGPSVRLLLTLRRRRGKEDPARSGERLGRPGRDRPEGPLVWIHGASVGESLSALPLVDLLLKRDPALRILVTSGTMTSASILAARLPDRAFHQYVPVDLPSAARRFVAHWRPDATLWLESELWPNLLSEIAGAGGPAVLVNGRISPRSFRRWRRFPGFARHLLGQFDLCLAQSPAHADRLRALGAGTVECHGNLKYAAAPLPADPGELDALRRAVGERPVWLAASTHPGEEAIVAEAHRTLLERQPDLLTIIVPRHPERGAALQKELGSLGAQVARRAAGDELSARTGIYLADTLGELGLFYRLVPVVFVGGTLVAHGGQNPLEPAHLDCALVCGPSVFNFQEIVETLEAAGGAERIDGAAALADSVGRLLDNPPAAAAQAAAARKAARREAGVLARIGEALEPYLPPPAPKRAARRGKKARSGARA